MFSGGEGGEEEEEEEEEEEPPPLEMKEPFLLRRRRKTRLLAGNIGTAPHMSNGTNWNDILNGIKALMTLIYLPNTLNIPLK